MRTKLFFFTIAWLFPLVVASALRAQPVDTCLARLPNYSESTLKARVDSCSPLIKSGTLSREDLENAYVHRGFAYQHMDQQDDALLDFSQAIQILPADPDPYLARATSFVSIGMYFKSNGRGTDARVQYYMAINDLSRAIELTGADARRRALAFCQRSHVFSIMGESEKAKSDSAEMLRIVLGSNIRTPPGCG